MIILTHYELAAMLILAVLIGAFLVAALMRAPSETKCQHDWLLPYQGCNYYRCRKCGERE